MKSEDREAWEVRLAALERENARLRRLLDEIHRGESERPRVPKRYDEATQAREDA